MKPTVVIGLLGPILDKANPGKRWSKWRPTVALCQHEDLLVSRFELLYQSRWEDLAHVVAGDIASCSPETEVRLHKIPMEKPWDFQQVYGSLHDFARSYPFDTDKEQYLIHITTGTHVAQICLFLLTEARYLPGVLIQASPSGRDKAGKYSIIDLNLSRYDKIASRFQQEQIEGVSLLKGGIQTRNKAFNGLISLIERVAISSHSPILLMGPTGAGKSQLARRIYDLKKHRRHINGPIVEVNCATIRGEGAMSALFGHKKGSFTGAVESRGGLLHASNKGLLFLDEIGELGLDEQAMLLRAIEEKKFLPVGSDREAQSDFQLIAGTNRDLSHEVARGKFREDLFARINLWTFRLPGLAERREDIEPNLDYELDQFARSQGTRVTMNKEARSRFLKFAQSPASSWQSNFRDLNAAVTRMATLCEGGRVTEDVVEEEIGRLKAFWRHDFLDSSPELIRLLGEEKCASLDLFDQAQLQCVLAICGKSQSLSEAGRALFAVSREQKKNPNDADRLRKYLQRFGLSWEQIRKA